MEEISLIGQFFQQVAASKSILVDLSDRWLFAVLLPSCVFLINRIRPVSRRTSALLFPAMLLFARKAALFVPVSGAISTEDFVIFWWIGAYWPTLTVMVFGAWLIRRRARRNKRRPRYDTGDYSGY